MRAKDVEALGEDVIVDEAGVDGTHTHHEDNIATTKEDFKDLRAVDIFLQLVLLDYHVESKQQHDGS